METKFFLSRAGKLVLIKAVVQAIPAYLMSIFKFPAIVCHELDMRGLGFRNFSESNDALLAKQCWLLIFELDSLWGRVDKARYFTACSFSDAKKKGRASWAWTSPLAERELLRNGSNWQIMGGEDVRVWVDRWLLSLPREHPVPLGEVAVTPNLRVNSLIRPWSHEWDIGFLQLFISEVDQVTVRRILLGDLRRKDQLVWEASKTGQYSVKLGYYWLQLRLLGLRDQWQPGARLVPKELSKVVWRLPGPPKFRHFFWLLLHNGHATRVVLFRRRSFFSPNLPYLSLSG